MAQAEGQGLLQQRKGLKSGVNAQVVLSCLLAFPELPPEPERNRGTGNRCSGSYRSNPGVLRGMRLEGPCRAYSEQEALVFVFCRGKTPSWA